jgi:UDP-N-acetylglucosamine 1-carboxyvinyltransferase
VHLTNVPHLNDISTMLRLIGADGRRGRRWTAMRWSVLDSRGLNNPVAPYDMVKTMRASILVLGPLVARCGEAGCRCPAAARSARGRSTSTSRACRRWAPRFGRAGLRPCQGVPRLKGARIVHRHGDRDRHREPDDGGGAWPTAKRSSRTPRASRRWSIWPTAWWRWARRSPGAGTDVIRIRGVERLHGATHRIMPDRIETGTYLCAAAATGGDVRLTGTSAATSTR